MVAATGRRKTIEVYVGRAEKQALKEFAARRRQSVKSIVEAWLLPQIRRIDRRGHAVRIDPATRPLPRVRVSRHVVSLQIFQRLRFEAARRRMSLPGLLYSLIAPELRRISH